MNNTTHEQLQIPGIDWNDDDFPPIHKNAVTYNAIRRKSNKVKDLDTALNSIKKDIKDKIK